VAGESVRTEATCGPITHHDHLVRSRTLLQRPAHQSLPVWTLSEPKPQTKPDRRATCVDGALDDLERRQAGRAHPQAPRHPAAQRPVVVRLVEPELKAHLFRQTAGAHQDRIVDYRRALPEPRDRDAIAGMGKRSPKQSPSPSTARSAGPARFAHTDLSRATFEDVDLSRARFRDVELSGATLENARLSQATLRDVDLAEATIENASLASAALRDVELRGATIENANLSQVRLRDVELSGATLTDVDLSRVRIRDCKLTGLTIDGVRVDRLLALAARRRTR
jgi:hypothetical protein